MPFSLESDNLPDYVKKQPVSVAKRWIEIFDQYFLSDNEAVAWTMANAWLKRVIEFNGNQEPSTAEQQESLELVDMKFDTPEEEIVVRAIGDEEFIDFILTDTDYDNKGTGYEEGFLEELAQYINDNGIVGDFNHEMEYRLKQAGITPLMLKEKMKGKTGIAKAVKAIVEEGKLFIRTTFDKRYRKRILESKGVSVEGVFVRDKNTNKYVGGTILGFSFVDSPVLDLGNPRAVRV